MAQTTIPTIKTVSRNQVLDLLRITFAIFVLLAHAVEITDGNRSRELFSRLTHSSMSFGDLGVDGFFLLSGFLILRSWLGDPEWANFVRKRVLRIVPGYVVAFVLSVIVVQLIAPGTTHIVGKDAAKLLASFVTLSSPYTPHVFPGMPYHDTNSSMWTIAYEFRCYLFVALAGVLGLYRRPMIWLALTLILLVGFSLPYDTFRGPLHASYHHLFGNPPDDIRLCSIFMLGGCFYLFRKYIVFRPMFAAIAAAALVALTVLDRSRIELAIVVFGSYLLFYLIESNTVSKMTLKRFPDISYGVYLYGFPVESVWVWYHHGSPWITFAASTAICAVLGWLSWECVERPMLLLKKRATAAVPPAGIEPFESITLSGTSPRNSFGGSSRNLPTVKQ